MKRRHFISALAGAGAALVEAPWKPRFRLAKAQNLFSKTLIVIFQRGGCDGLNTIVPYGDDEYYNLRPNIAIAPPLVGDDTTALDIDGFFGFHPSMGGFRDIYQNGHLAIFPTVHYPNGTRSHFSSMAWLESGQPRFEESGWLNRHLESTERAAALRAVGLGRRPPQSLRGNHIVSAFLNLREFKLRLPAEEQAILLGNLEQIYDQPAPEPEDFEDDFDDEEFEDELEESPDEGL